MFILSHVLGNKLFYVSVVLVNQIRVILPQTSFELHVHVVCSPFYLGHILLKHSKHETKHIDHFSLHKIYSC